MKRWTICPLRTPKKMSLRSRMSCRGRIVMMRRLRAIGKIVMIQVTMTVVKVK